MQERTLFTFSDTTLSGDRKISQTDSQMASGDALQSQNCFMLLGWEVTAFLIYRPMPECQLEKNSCTLPVILSPRWQVRTLYICKLVWVTLFQAFSSNLKGMEEAKSEIRILHSIVLTELLGQAWGSGPTDSLINPLTVILHVKTSLFQRPSPPCITKGSGNLCYPQHKGRWCLFLHLGNLPSIILPKQYFTSLQNSPTPHLQFSKKNVTT